MRVELVGTNVPLSVIEDVLTFVPKEKRDFYRARLSPIPICAAYARISRDHRDVDILLKKAIEDIKGSAKSAQQIAFGMGHHSVADHAIFNFDLIGVSRLLIEEIEARRIAGYTEKSQRYITLDGDFVIPKEFSPQDLRKFEELVALQNAFYTTQNQRLLEHLTKKHPKLDEKSLESMAKEDARYGLSLATEAQLGCSYGGETAEHAIRVLRQSELQEGRDLAEKLVSELQAYLPIVQLIDPATFEKFNPGAKLDENYFLHTRDALRGLTREIFKKIKPGAPDISYMSGKNDVYVMKPNSVDDSVIAALLFANSNKPIIDCYGIAAPLSRGSQIDFIKKALVHLSKYDKVPREFEIGGSDFVFSADISSSCFAQLKRHRMMTLISQDYNPNLDVVIPESIQEINAESELREVTDKSLKLYNEFKPRYGKPAEYCLTNAHKRRVLVGANIRELYHISRMREDEHAQWEIRHLANEMSDFARDIAPASSLLLAGKHEFDELRSKVYED